MRALQLGDFPRVGWKESMKIRTTLIRAFNVSRVNPHRLESLAKWLQFMQNKVRAAQLELEVGTKEPEVVAPVEITVAAPQVLTIPAAPAALTIPVLKNVE